VNLSPTVLLSFGLAVFLSLAMLWAGRRAWQVDDSQPQVRVLGVYSPVLTWLKYRRLAQVRLRPITWPNLSRLAIVIPEVGAVGLWALWVGRAYLDFSPTTWPIGREFGYQIQSHHLWTSLSRCGLCALWNGSINGGYPALGDGFGSMLHPLVMATTLLWGVAVGAKLSLVGALWMAGAAQWWLAWTLGLGRVARLWSALLAVAAGHLSGRIDLGAFGLVLSVAAVSLALAAAYYLAVKRTRTGMILLAITGAMALVSGHGYLQLGLAAAAPALALLGLDKQFQWRPVARDFLLAIGLCFLLAGIFLVPLLHFWPAVNKSGNFTFDAAQPLEYVPLNLVVRDLGFLSTEVLHKYPYPYLYNNYIGWVPVLLALLCLRVGRRSDAPVLLSLASAAGLTFFLASGAPFRWLSGIVPSIAGIRHVPLFAALAVPAILALAAYTVDRLWVWPWPTMALRSWQAGGRRERAPIDWGVGLRGLLLMALAGALIPVYQLSQVFLTVVEQLYIYRAMPVFDTPTLQWVAAPYGEHVWIEPGLAAGLKLTGVGVPWWWKDRPNPKPVLMAVRGEAPPDAVLSERDLLRLPIYALAGAEYATAMTATGSVPCAAAGHGGDLTVTCGLDQPGTLIVKEHTWPGWRAWIDQAPATLRLDGEWLEIAVPPGQHVVELRYRPWDAALGAMLTVVGMVLAVWLWRQPHDLSVAQAGRHAG
jgi:hypothetical protein